MVRALVLALLVLASGCTSTLDVIDEGIRECAELVHHAWWLQQRLLQLRSRLGGAEGRSDGQG